MLPSMKSVFNAVLVCIRFQLPVCLLAIVIILFGTAGCLPPSNPAPSAGQIFLNPPANTNFAMDSGSVILSRSALNYTTVCYTTDGSRPAFAAASCAGGSTATYLASIDISCNSEETSTIQKTVNIVFVWDGVEAYRSANYYLVCSVDPWVTVFNLSGAGEIVGQVPGTLTITGSAQLDQVTGVLTFRSSNTSVTDFFNITTADVAIVSGLWTEPVMSVPVGLTTITDCINNGGFANGCDYVALDDQSNRGITLASDLILFDLNAGGVTVFSTSVDLAPPEVPLAVTINITYTLTALDINEELPTFTVGGDVTGLTTGTLVLDINEGELLSVAVEGGVNFTTEFNDGAFYSISVHSDPSGLLCEVSNGIGSISGADVTDISVICSDPLIADLVFLDATLATCVADVALSLMHMSELTELDCKSMGILDASGIDQLTALTSLNLNNNLLTSIDISNNTALSVLNITSNQLTSIDLSNNLALTAVNFYNNLLAQIDISKNTALTNFYANTNPLTSVNLSSNTGLKVLILGENPLTSLDLSNNTSLEVLVLLSLNFETVDLANNLNLTTLLLLNLPLISIDLTSNVALAHIQINDSLLSGIDVSANTAAKTIHLANNQLSAIDMSANTAMTSLKLADNQLSAIDLSTNTALTTLALTNNQLTTINLDANTLLDIVDLEGNVFDAATLSYLAGLTISNLTY